MSTQLDSQEAQYANTLDADPEIQALVQQLRGIGQGQVIMGAGNSRDILSQLHQRIKDLGVDEGEWETKINFDPGKPAYRVDHKNLIEKHPNEFGALATGGMFALPLAIPGLVGMGGAIPAAGGGAGAGAGAGAAGAGGAGTAADLAKEAAKKKATEEGGLSFSKLMTLLGIQTGANLAGGALAGDGAQRRSFADVPDSNPNKPFVDPINTRANVNKLGYGALGGLVDQASHPVQMKVPGYDVPGVPFQIGGQQAQSPLGPMGGTDQLSQLIAQLQKKGTAV